ncbi:MAG: hypothetical protein WC708_00675 [Lentisphaeria bacterium]|jgi:hypothetical protein
MSILKKFKPENFQTKGHYWDTFGHTETEVSAKWVIRFLKHRNAMLKVAGRKVPDNGWAPFTYGQINTFYRKMRRKSKNPGESITFNRLVPGTHYYMSSSPNPPKDRKCISPGHGMGLGYNHLCENDSSIDIEKVEGGDPHQPNPGDIYRVTEKFVSMLATNPQLLIR